MAEPDPKPPRPTSLGVYERPRPDTVTRIEITAIVLSLLWLAGAGLFLAGASEEQADTASDPLRIMVTAMAVVLPVAMIWVAALAARSSKVMREESQRLQAALDALRQAYLAQSQGGKGAESPLSRKLDELLAVSRRTEAALATQGETRTEAPAPAALASPAVEPAPTEDQPTLALGTTEADRAPPLPSADFIRALNFPDTAEDKEGFAALRRALRDRTTGQLVQAAQDVLTLLSYEGIYMDDLSPDRARPEVWREFARGARGRAISSLGGIRDRSSLALTAGRMKQDPIFRDAAHHFLRKFDHTFAAFEPNASDAEISALANTRTARAFMLLGRVAGTFD